MGQENIERVCAYIRLIEERVINQIKKPDIQNSCTATLMLIFSALDGLSKLYVEDYQDNHRSVRKRFYKIFNFMGGKYQQNKLKLYKIRNSIIHEAINYESYMSHSDETQILHLEELDNSGFMYINTKQFSIDLEDTINKFKSEIESNPTLANRAENRLEWREVNILDIKYSSHSSPAPIEFIRTK